MIITIWFSPLIERAEPVFVFNVLLAKAKCKNNFVFKHPVKAVAGIYTQKCWFTFQPFIYFLEMI